MEHEFWLNKWQQQQIGFHLSAPHPLLQRYKDECFDSGPVFVPLCGKSLDMVFLAEQGHKVLGVELSETAVVSFFKERDLAIEKELANDLMAWRGGDYEIFQGDYFHLSSPALEQTRQVYDRAALIALPKPMRESYVEHLEKIMPSDFRVLLITLDYHQDEMSGPPFAVSEQEVRHLYRNAREIKQLRYTSIIDQEPSFREQGLTDLFQGTYFIQY